MNITESEILDELRASIGEDRPAGFYTVTELATQAKISRDAVRRKLALWKSEGRLESCFARVTRSDGNSHRTTVYRLKPKKSR